MNALEVNKEYIDLVLREPANYIEDYKMTLKKAANSTAIYKGKPVPFLYHPMFFVQEDIDNFNKIGDLMISITNKVTNKYIEDKDFRAKFGFPKLIEDLIEIDNGYDINVPIGRFDIFYKDYNNFKFCELNTDGSSAMNEDNTIGRILLETKAIKDFKKDYEFKYFELFHSWVDESIKIFKKFDPHNLKPNVAIVDFIESGTSAEFDEFKKAYEEKCYNCIIADPRDLVYKNGALYKDDYKIDLVYRRIVTFELMEKADQIKDFIEAYKDKAMCVIGSIRSQVIHNKIFFKILHDKDTLDLLSTEEREFVKNHIPVTGLFMGDEEVFNMVLNNKEKYIMKPLDLNASQGVFTGRDLSHDEWEKRLRESFNKDYLYQEFFDPFIREFIVFEDDKPSIQGFGSIIGLFLYNEILAGMYTRIGKENIISGLSSYYTVPNILVEPKNNI